MKIALSLVLIASAALTLVGCGSSSSTDGAGSAKASAAASAPAAPTMASKPAPVTDMLMDPRIVEPCVTECKAKHADAPSPAYMECFNGCKKRMADEINAQAR